MIHYAILTTPLGPMLAVADEEQLVRLTFVDGHDETTVPAHWAHGGPILSATEEQLSDYFAGRRSSFTLPLAPQGTPFQHRVWDALLRTPYGTTTSYSTLAATLGSPRSARAVGAANARNPLHVVVPCHRVIAADGSLSGYAAGPLRKRALLDLERTSS